MATKAKKAPMLTLGHDYFLDDELTLKKRMISKDGKEREKVIGYYGNIPQALKRYADELMTAGITDGEREKGMIREEIQIVRRRLDDYASYKALALEADRKARETQVRIENFGQYQSPCWDKVAPIQNHTDWESRLTELISDQAEYERDAARWHKAMYSIEKYIAGFEGETRSVMKLHFIQGLTFEDIEEMVGISTSGLKMKVYRALEASPFESASALL